LRTERQMLDRCIAVSPGRSNTRYSITQCTTAIFGQSVGLVSAVEETRNNSVQFLDAIRILVLNFVFNYVSTL
jgi:hypothetical protein